MPFTGVTNAHGLSPSHLKSVCIGVASRLSVIYWYKLYTKNGMREMFERFKNDVRLNVLKT